MIYPVCATCRRELKPRRNGVTVIEITKDGPYRIWKADLSRCPGCQADILVGYGKQPFAEHFQPNFIEELVRARAFPEWTFEVHCI